MMINKKKNIILIEDNILDDSKLLEGENNQENNNILLKDLILEDQKKQSIEEYKFTSKKLLNLNNKTAKNSINYYSYLLQNHDKTKNRFKKQLLRITSSFYFIFLILFLSS